MKIDDTFYNGLLKIVYVFPNNDNWCLGSWRKEYTFYNKDVHIFHKHDYTHGDFPRFIKSRIFPTIVSPGDRVTPLEALVESCHVCGKSAPEDLIILSKIINWRSEQ